MGNIIRLAVTLFVAPALITASPWPGPRAFALPLAFPGRDALGMVEVPPTQHYHLPHTYIIHFQDDISQGEKESHLQWIRALESTNQQVKEFEQAQPAPEINTQDFDSHGSGLVVMRHVFEIAYNGYSACIMNQEVLNQIRSRLEVDRIERVGITDPKELPLMEVRDPTTALRVQDMNSTHTLKDGAAPDQASNDSAFPELTVMQDRGWNTVRISHRTYTKGYDAGPWVRDQNLGKGVTVYVFDTGINLEQPGFKGSKVTFGRNFVGWRIGSRKNDDKDNHGHGTMCAGVIAGEKHGLSPEAHTVAVKIAGK
jgi:hypothetical protein